MKFYDSNKKEITEPKTGDDSIVLVVFASGMHVSLLKEPELRDDLIGSVKVMERIRKSYEERGSK